MSDPLTNGISLWKSPPDASDEQVKHHWSFLAPDKPLIESCRKCGAIGDTTGKREIWSDDVIQYLCDDCCKAMGRVRFVMTRKGE